MSNSFHPPEKSSPLSTTPADPLPSSTRVDSPAPHAPEEAIETLRAFAALHDEIQRSKQVGGTFWGTLQSIASKAQAILGSSGVALAVTEGGRIVCRGSAGSLAPPPGTTLNPTSGFTALCYRTGTIVRCDDAERDDRVDKDACRSHGIRSMVAAPLRQGETILGLIEAFDAKPMAFTDNDVRTLNLFGELAVEAMKPRENPPAPRTPEPAIASASDWTAAATQPVIFRSLEPPKEARFRLTWLLLGVLGFLVAGTALGWFIWNHRRAEAAPTISTASTEPASAVEIPQVSTESLLPKVTGIRNWSDADSTTVVIDLQGDVNYETHKLTSPAQGVFFDLHDTVLAKEFASKTIEVGGDLVSRIRIGQPQAGVVRVVLETKNEAKLTVSQEPNPPRLLIEFRNLNAPPKPKLQGQQLFPAAPQIHFPDISPPSAEDKRLRALVPHLRIVLDAAHGGWDVGAMGQKGVLEKDLALEITQRLGQMLEQRLGLEVIYTRADDTFVPLERRAVIANEVGADLFVSIHANYSSDSATRGVETFYTASSPSTRVMEAEEREVGPTPELNMTPAELRTKSDSSRRLAVTVQQALFSAVSGNIPGSRNRGVKAASFVVLTGTMMPAILAEVSFVSSPQDETNLRDPHYRQALAEALYRGVARYSAQNARDLARKTTHRAGL
jgi:N-acetylmuramoyl-L-alanine amidase